MVREKEALRLYVIYHDDKSYKICYEKLHMYSWVRFIEIETTKFCESIIFKYLLELINTDDDERACLYRFDFIGFITYSFADKIELKTLLDAVKRVEEGQFENYDVIGLRGLNFGIGDISQSGIEKILRLIFDNIALGKKKEEKPTTLPIEAPLLQRFEQVYKPVVISVADLKARARSKKISADRVVRNMLLEKQKSLEIIDDLSDVLVSRDVDDDDDGSDQHSDHSLSELSDFDDNENTIEDLRTKDVPAFFSNYWLARPQILFDYLIWLKKIFEIIEYADVSDSLSMNSGYKNKSDDYIPIFGKPWMTWHPFVMERMICIYSHLNKLRVFIYKSTLKPKNDRTKFG